MIESPITIEFAIPCEVSDAALYAVAELMVEAYLARERTTEAAEDAA